MIFFIDLKCAFQESLLYPPERTITRGILLENAFFAIISSLFTTSSIAKEKPPRESVNNTSAPALK